MANDDKTQSGVIVSPSEWPWDNWPPWEGSNPFQGNIQQPQNPMSAQDECLRQQREYAATAKASWEASMSAAEREAHMKWAWDLVWPLFFVGGGALVLYELWKGHEHKEQHDIVSLDGE